MSPALLLLALATGAPPEPAANLKLPPGFAAHLFADHDLAPDISMMTIDDAGRVLVAGPGYVRVLVSDGGNGSATRAVDIIDGLKQAPMGLLAEGDSLFVVCDGGLKRYRGYDGASKLKKPETILALKTGGEHDAHAVRRGPDGWLYLLCGNMAGVKKETIKGARSPVKNPVAGALLRLSPDFRQVEVVADGFRNPYSFDFNLDGEPFTYDSDNERCVGLPWYEGCRFYHIVPGGNHGWRSPQISQTWRKPPYFPDVVPPVCDTGRGSPTGVVCYRHTHFPDAHRGNFFIADWTFGRIYRVPLKPGGASYSGKHEVFAEATGTSGFAPTALAVHPKTGELFASIGGRGTRGGVYRITYDKAEADPKPLAMAKRTLDFDKESAKQWLADCASDDARTRRVALEMIVRWWDKTPWGKPLNEAVKANLTHDDRLVRRAAARVGKQWFIDLGKLDQPLAKLMLALESARDEPKWALNVALAALDEKTATEAELLAALRVVHLAHGDLTAKDAVGTAWEGYTFRETVADPQRAQLQKALAALGARLEAGAEPREVNLELARAFAAVGADEEEAPRVTLSRITPDTSHADDFHYILALARMTEGTRAGGRTAVEKLFGMLAKAKAGRVLTDRHWPMRLEEMVARLARGLSLFRFAVLEHPDFGRPEHATFARVLNPPLDQVAERFLKAAEKDENYAWRPGVVELLAHLPRAKTDLMLNRLWEQPHLTDAVLKVLTVEPREGDQPKLVAGLASVDATVVYRSADALTKLKTTSGSGVHVAAVKALRRFPDEQPKSAVRTAVRTALFSLLQQHTGQKIGPDEKAWAAWVAKSDPAAAKQFDAADGFDAAAWKKRLSGIDWSQGHAERGRAAFAKATCAACHDGGRAVGPPLAGIAKRFSRDDLLTAILQPNRDVSARYRPTRIVTTEETSYTGVIVYEAVDGVILQTGADTTVRIAGANIASKRQVDVSLMPAGLIDKLSDQEIADLMAYLGTLGDPKPK